MGLSSIIRALLILVALLLLVDPAHAQCTGQPDANTVCAGPPGGGPGLPFFRSLTPADVPAAAGQTVIQNNTTPINGGQNGRLFFNNNGYFSDFILGGDCTFLAPNLTCTKTGGLNFSASATTDTTNAANISSGYLGNARLNIATVNEFKAGTSGRLLQADRVFTAEIAVSFGSTTTFDFATFINASVLLAGNIDTVTFTNMKPGQAGMIRFIQDGTGGRTIPPAINANLKCPGGCDYTLSTEANAVDALPYQCLANNYCIGGPLLKDLR